MTTVMLCVSKLYLSKSSKRDIILNIATLKNYRKRRVNPALANNQVEFPIKVQRDEQQSAAIRSSTFRKSEKSDPWTAF